MTEQELTDLSDSVDLPRIFDSDAAREYMNIVPALIVGLEDGIIYHTTPSLDRMFGYFTIGELRGKLVETLVPQDKREQHIKDRNEFSIRPLPKPMGQRRGQLTGLCKDGCVIRVAISLSGGFMMSGRRCVAAIVLPIVSSEVSVTKP